MRAITVRQPWAWAIIHGGKDVENRAAGFPSKYRGQLLIHAGSAWSERGRLDTRVDDAYRAAVGVGPRNPMRPHPIMAKPVMSPAGLVHDSHHHTDPSRRIILAAIIGMVDLVDVHPDAGCCRPWGESSYTGFDGEQHRNVSHLVLENPRPLPDDGVFARGRLGLWQPSDDELWSVEAAMEDMAVRARNGIIA